MPTPESSRRTPSETAPQSKKEKIELLRLTPEQRSSAIQEMSNNFGVTSEEARKIIEIDIERLSGVIYSIKTETTEGVLTAAFDQEIKTEQLSNLANKVDYDHNAILLVLPLSTIEELLGKEGFRDAKKFPSKIVSGRLAEHYETKECPTTILKASIDIPDPDNKTKTVTRKIEIFRPNPPEGTWGLKQIKIEQTKNPESHTAFVVKDNSSVQEVKEEFLDNGLEPDGAGTNTDENSTTLYFINKKGERFELIKYGVEDTELVSLHLSQQMSMALQTDIVK